jgi:hypothetical protein
MSMADQQIEIEKKEEGSAAGEARTSITRRRLVQAGAVAGGALVLAAVYSKPSIHSVTASANGTVTTPGPEETPTATPTSTPTPKCDCSPGYWKNHTDPGDWPSGYSPSHTFGDTFGCSESSELDDLTLLEALAPPDSENNNKLRQLAKQAAAALLCAASGADFDLTEAQVIEITCDAIEDGSNGALNGAKDQLEGEIAECEGEDA